MTAGAPTDRTRPLAVLLAVFCLAFTGWILRDSGLATAPGLALRSLPQGRLVRSLPPGTPFEQPIEHFVYKGTTGTYIDDWVYYTGSYETHVLKLLREILQQGWPDGDAVFLDIGANAGQHSLYLSPNTSKVHAIEPWPPALVRLDAGIADNHIDNVVVHRVGFGNETGSMPFFAPPDSNLGTGSFAADHSGRNKPSQQLPIVVGDDWLAEQGVDRIDLIKIDIEGFERFALQGLKRTLRRDRPIVMLELNVRGAGGFRNRQQLDDTFPKDYVYFRVKTPEDYGAWSISLLGWRWMYGPEVTGEREFTPFDDRFVDSDNLVAVPKERVAQLPARTR